MQREYSVPPRVDFALLSDALADLAGDMVRHAYCTLACN